MWGGSLTPTLYVHTDVIVGTTFSFFLWLPFCLFTMCLVVPIHTLSLVMHILGLQWTMFRACDEHFELSRSLPLDQKISPRLKQNKKYKEAKGWGMATLKKNSWENPTKISWKHIEKRLRGGEPWKLLVNHVLISSFDRSLLVIPCSKDSIQSICWTNVWVLSIMWL